MPNKDLITTNEVNEMDDINIENTISETEEVENTEIEEVQTESEEVETTEPEEMVVEVENDEEDRSVASEIAYRTIDLSKSSYIDEEKRTVKIGVSSEQPVSRSFGLEVLDHKNTSIDTEFMDSKTAPFLLDHDMSQVIGVVEDFKIDETAKRTTAVVRFGKSDLASEIFEDVKDGIRKNISVGYRVNKMERDSNDIIGDHYRATSWTPMEISSVGIPADQSVLVGVGRKDKQELNFKDIKMETENKIDSNAIRSEATESVKAEMLKNAKEISALGKHHGQRDLADNAIQNGMSVEQFRGVLLDNISNDKALEVAPANLGLNESERSEYSLIKAINASSTGDWSKAGYERELSEEIAKRTGKEARGFYMPSDLNWGQRDQTAGTDSQGGYLVGTDHLADQFISALYAKLTVGDLGARVMTGLKGDIAIPKLSAQTTNTAFVAEGSAPTEGAAVFSQVTLTPKTLASYVDCTRKLMLQSDPSVEAVLRNDIISQFARKIDSVAINGGGSNEPSGIIPGVASGNVVSMGTNGTAPTYAKIVDLIKAVDVSNAMGGNPSFLTNPKVIAALRTIAKQSGGAEGNFIMEAASEILGYNVASTTLVPSNLSKGTGSNLSAAIFGDFTNVMLGFWSGVDVVVDTASLSTSGGTRLAFFQDLDVAIRHDTGFGVIKDIVA
jgi:HK97 family phage major capsid protein